MAIFKCIDALCHVEFSDLLSWQSSTLDSATIASRVSGLESQASHYMKVVTQQLSKCDAATSSGSKTKGICVMARVGAPLRRIINLSW